MFFHLAWLSCYELFRVCILERCIVVGEPIVRLVS